MRYGLPQNSKNSRLIDKIEALWFLPLIKLTLNLKICLSLKPDPSSNLEFLLVKS
jgi:hypothetical protein